MLIESERRRAGFKPGVTILLADDCQWTLPAPSTVGPLPTAGTPHRPGQFSSVGTQLRDLLDAVCEAEDETEGQRAELALTIYLLKCNYDLKPEEISTLLSFSPHDRRGANSRKVVHQWVEDYFERFAEPTVSALDPPHETKRSRLSRLVQFWAHLAPRSRSALVVSRSRAESR